jgi:predicted permease
MRTLLADAAPTGAGLAIIAIILVAFLLIVLGILVGFVFLIRRLLRRRRPEENVSASG